MFFFAFWLFCFSEQALFSEPISCSVKLLDLQFNFDVHLLEIEASSLFLCGILTITCPSFKRLCMGSFFSLMSGI